MSEGSKLDIAFTSSDNEGDDISFSATSTSESLSVKVHNNTLSLTAMEVGEDLTETVTLIASDGKASTTKSIIVSIKNAMTNTPPEIIIDTSNLSLKEASTASIPFSINDLDSEDQVTVSVAASNDILVLSIVENKLLLTAPNVSQDTQVTITITASDGKESVSKQIQVLIKDIPYAPFTIQLTDITANNLQVRQNSIATYPFTINKGSVDIADLTYSINIMNNDDGVGELSAIIDVTKQEVVVSPDSENRGVYNGTVTVTDGTTTQSFDFITTVEFYQPAPFLNVRQTVFLEVGETLVMDTTSSDSLDPESVIIHEDLTHEFLSGDSNLLTFSYDNSAKTYSFTAKSGSAFNYFRVRVYTTDSLGGVGGKPINIYVKGAKSPLELEVEEKSVIAQSYIEQSNELDKLAHFLLEILNLNGTISERQLLAEKLLISDTRSEIATVYSPYLSCALDTVKNGIPSYIKYDYYNAKNELVCDIREEQVLISEHFNSAETNHYAEAANHAIAVSIIENIKIEVNTAHYAVNNEDLVDRVNRLAYEVSKVIPTFYMGHVEFSPMLEVKDGVYSRFFGNETYGAYVDNVWTWKPEYQVLSGVVNVI
ncbi:hypothetical protein [Shewanella halifaxensis]|uniref:hypothetical protein n=1 Tax=Shewanella halifaxensis TaxID=271098 RepID=UPI000D58DE14|nr:hypothetical protein [Shewanella halifaxensis]